MAETKKEVVTEEKVTEKPKTKKASSKKSETAKEAKKAPAKRAASKKAPAAKEEKKAEVKEVKPTVTEAKAKVLGLKVTPRKVRLVLDLVRGKNVDEAIVKGYYKDYRRYRTMTILLIVCFALILVSVALVLFGLW